MCQIPQSENGGVHPELRARVSAAKAHLDQFGRETEGFIAGNAPRPSWESWAWQMHTDLKLILAMIDAEPQS